MSRCISTTAMPAAANAWAAVRVVKLVVDTGDEPGLRAQVLYERAKPPDRGIAAGQQRLAVELDQRHRLPRGQPVALGQHHL